MNARAGRLFILGCLTGLVACGKDEPLAPETPELNWLRYRLRGTEWVESKDYAGMYESEVLSFMCNDSLRLTHPAYGTATYAYNYPEKWLYGYLFLGRYDAPGIKHLPWFIYLSENDTIMEIYGQKVWTTGGEGLELRGRYTLKQRENC